MKSRNSCTQLEQLRAYLAWHQYQQFLEAVFAPSALWKQNVIATNPVNVWRCWIYRIILMRVIWSGIIYKVSLWFIPVARSCLCLTLRVQVWAHHWHKLVKITHSKALSIFSMNNILIWTFCLTEHLRILMPHPLWTDILPCSTGTAPCSDSPLGFFLRGG